MQLGLDVNVPQWVLWLNKHFLFVVCYVCTFICITKLLSTFYNVLKGTFHYCPCLTILSCVVSG